MESMIYAALVSKDEELRKLATRAVATAGSGIEIGVEIGTAFERISEEELHRLREVDPLLIFVDLEDDPVLGTKFAHFLMDQNPARRVVAFGPELPPDRLLAAMRAGISDYLVKPVAAEAMQQAVIQARRRLAPGGGEAGPQQPAKLFAFFSPKGGAGSTTVATNLAIHLRRVTGKRVLLVDLDIELGEVAVQLGIEPRFSFVDLVRNFHRIDAGLLTTFIEQHETGVHLLSAPYHPERSELVTADDISKILRFLRQHYDYIIVDTSKSFAPPTLAIFEQADCIYLVATLDLPSLRNIKRCQPLLNRVLGSTDDRVRLVVNRYDSDSPISLEDVTRTLGMRVYWTIANDYEAVMRSINTGKPIILDSRSQYARDIKELGAEIAGLRASGERRAGPLQRAVSQVLARVRPPAAPAR